MKRPDPVTELLDAEAASARATMSRSFAAVKGAATQVADPREWVRAHPWATLGVTAAAGFVAAPGREQWNWGRYFEKREDRKREEAKERRERAKRTEAPMDTRGYLARRRRSAAPPEGCWPCHLLPIHLWTGAASPGGQRFSMANTRPADSFRPTFTVTSVPRSYSASPAPGWRATAPPWKGCRA